MMKRLIYLMTVLFAISFNGTSQTWNSVGNASFGNGFFNGGPSCFSSLEKLYIDLDNVSGCTLTNIPVNGICSFDGTKVDSLGGGAEGRVHAAEWYNGKLIVAGEFSGAGPGQWGLPNTYYIAAWDSINGWSSITPNGGASSYIYCMAKYNGNLYVGGTFTSVNNVSSIGIAKWNGTSWSHVGAGSLSGWVTCMAVYHNQLYVGGSIGLPNSTNNSFYNIVRWNGTQWDSVGCRMNQPPLALVVDSVRDVLYAGGYFSAVGSTVAFGVAKWNDTIWSSLGSGTDTLGITYCMAMFNGELYAGGGSNTVTSQGDTLNYIYKFNGTKWVGVAGGANNYLTSMAAYQGNLYIGGDFWQVGYGLPARRIACYGTSCPTTVGIAQQPPPVPFNMFPNPNDGELHIESEEPQQLIFRLSSSEGKLIAEKKFSNKLDYSTRGLAAGIYSVQICLGDGTPEGASRSHVEKLVVK